MTYLLLFLLGLCAAGLVLWLAAGLGLAVIPVAALAAGGMVLAEFATASWRGYRGDAPLIRLGIEPPDPADPGSGRDPAYRSYFAGPVLREFGLVLADTAQRSGRRLAGWYHLLVDGLFRRVGGIWWGLACFPPLVGALLGLAAGALLGAAVLLAIGVIYGALLAVLVLGAAATGGMLQLLEVAALSVRGITIECPHCHRNVSRPIYRCPRAGCGVAHRRLVPGSLGVFRRICRCGEPLPTFLLLGKRDLTAQCPHCRLELPRRGLSAPTLHIPVGGGPQVGKSVFMFSAVARLQATADAGSSGFDWADEYAAERFLAARNGILRPETMLKTTEQRPRAYTIYLGREGSRKRRLIYLYDAAGETNDSPDEMSAAHYYAFTRAVVICIDPFSLPGLRSRADPAVLRRASASPADPKATLERLTENLRERLAVTRSGKLAILAAVVLTKADALADVQAGHPYARLPAPGAAAATRGARDRAARSWIGEVGGRADLVTSVLNNFQTSSFFVVSHVDALGADGGGAPELNDDPAAPLRWLLGDGSSQ